MNKLRTETKVTKKGAILQSTIVGNNAMRKSEFIVVTIKKECVCETYDGKFTLEITTTQRPGNDMAWSKKDNHWSPYQLGLINGAGATITSWGHIYFKRRYATYGLAGGHYQKILKLATALTKTPDHLK
jgi:hypothetical protein